MKRRAGNKFCHFICLRRCADAGGQKNCRRDRRTQCKPALHDATSRFLCREVFAVGGCLANETWPPRSGALLPPQGCAAAACCCPALKRSHGRKKESPGFKNTSLIIRSAAIGSTLHSCAKKWNHDWHRQSVIGHPGEEHWASKGEVDLFLWRKRSAPNAPVIVFVMVHRCRGCPTSTFRSRVARTRRPWIGSQIAGLTPGASIWRATAGPARKGRSISTSPMERMTSRLRSRKL